ncbi:MAG: Xylose isomerase-like barrel, partial [Gemmataceae bacterium]|nr:Xylose isomerase-like barrel [Gemmataceae bacterium]
DLRDLEACIDLAAEMGFDAVEVLHRQMTDETPGYLQRLKRRAFAHGMSLCGFSTHQGFLSPKPEVRQKNVDHTTRCIEMAYALGIPTMRVNTGTWGTSKNFDDLMKNRGVEPPQPGFTDEDGFKWVVDGLTACLKAAEKCGVTLGLENHWGLGRTPEGVLRVVDAINSPWLRVGVDLSGEGPLLPVSGPHRPIRMKPLAAAQSLPTHDVGYATVGVSGDRMTVGEVSYSPILPASSSSCCSPCDRSPHGLQPFLNSKPTRAEVGGQRLRTKRLGRVLRRGWHR